MILTAEAGASEWATGPTIGVPPDPAVDRARQRVLAWLAHPDTAPQIAEAHLEHAAARSIARQVGLELSSWREWLLCIIDWPTSAISVLAAQARADGDAAAAEVLMAVGDASLAFDAFLPPTHHPTPQEP